MTRHLSVCLLAALLGSSASSAQQLATWTVAPNPVEYGADADDLFELIRFGRLFPDGQVVVADSKGRFLRVYSADGRRTAAFGRKGGGPGEFGGIYGLWLTRDGSIGVWDGGSRRLTRFDRSGSVLATHSVRAPSSMPGTFELFIGALRNGDVLLASLHLPQRPGPNEIVPERWPVGRFSADGEFRSPAGELRGMFRTHRTPLPFTPVPRVAVRGDSIWVAEGYEPQLKLYNATGQVVRTVEVPWRVRATSDQWSRLAADARARRNNLYLELLEEIPRPDQVPSIGGLLVDDRGFLWVKEYDPNRDSIWMKPGDALNIGSGGLWRIMNPAGMWVAQVRLPANLMPLDVVGNRILGVARDDLDVEHVVVHTIAR